MQWHSLVSGCVTPDTLHIHCVLLTHWIHKWFVFIPFSLHLPFINAKFVHTGIADYHENNSKVLYEAEYYFMIYTTKPAQDSINTTLSLLRSFLTCLSFGLCKMNGRMFSKKLIQPWIKACLKSSQNNPNHQITPNCFPTFSIGTIKTNKKFMPLKNFTQQ